MVVYYINAINIISYNLNSKEKQTMAKVDIYHYGSPTSVTSVTLSNCDSSDTADYAVLLTRTTNDSTVHPVDMIKPSGISGSTLTLTGSAVDGCNMIMVTQKG